ncbi:MAG: FHA domain-containing protein [Phycisphaerales bacterium]|nr:MAG: FHA domain-containing protein [Phycisphaerales bacterium]
MVPERETFSTQTAEEEPACCADDVEQKTVQPYLKVFGPDIGVVEYELSDTSLTIGRAEQADVRLPDPRVSRAHARLIPGDGQYVLQDLGSAGGITVNRKRIGKSTLNHGDSAQIGPYVLQFRQHHGLPGAATVTKRAKRLLQSEFTMLPSGMRPRFRVLETPPGEIFRSGDTLRIGQSGILLPAKKTPRDCVCIEVHLSWSDGKNKSYLGEVVGVIEEEATHWLCVKLHSVSRDAYQSILDAGDPGDWVDVIST